MGIQEMQVEKDYVKVLLCVEVQWGERDGVRCRGAEVQ